MGKYYSTADEIKDILKWSDNPMTIKQINLVLGNKLTSDDIHKCIRYWVKKGVILGKIKNGYKKIHEYSLFEEKTT